MSRVNAGAVLRFVQSHDWQGDGLPGNDAVGLSVEAVAALVKASREAVAAGCPCETCEAVRAALVPFGGAR